MYVHSCANPIKYLYLQGHFSERNFREMSFLLWSDIIRMEESIMTNTALRAEAQSADMAHMVFKDRKHEKFYYGKLAQARYQDCYHKALIYVLGISEDTRNHFSQIYDIKSGYIRPECLHQAGRQVAVSVW